MSEIKLLGYKKKEPLTDPVPHNNASISFNRNVSDWFPRDQCWKCWLTHYHDVELKALFHGLPPHLLQDGIDAHIAEVDAGLLQAHGWGHLWYDRLCHDATTAATAAVAGNDLWPCRHEEKIYHGVFCFNAHMHSTELHCRVFYKLLKTLLERMCFYTAG